MNFNAGNQFTDVMPADSGTPSNEEIVSQNDTSVSEAIGLSFPSDAAGLSNDSIQLFNNTLQIKQGTPVRSPLMSPLLYFHRSCNSLSNQTIEEEIGHHDIVDEEEKGNEHDSDEEGDSEINAFE